jgi:hypothetical protein
MLKWLVEDSDRLHAWSDLGSALYASRPSFCATQSFGGVDLAKAAKVFEQLDFPRPFVVEGLKALLDGGLDDLAVEVEAKLPPGCFGSEYCAWPKLGARALLGGAFKFVTALLRPRDARVVRDRDIAEATCARLRELGQGAAAAAFGREFTSTLADGGNKGAFDDDGSDEAFEDDWIAAAIEGRRLAVKLRVCTVLAK